MEYTKGPWAIKKTDFGYCVIMAEKNENGKYNKVCMFPGAMPKDISLPLAKLIQASPDMYEACLAALDAQTNKEIEAAKKLCHAAIQKATL